MTKDEQERLELLAGLMGMSLEEAADLIGDMTVKDVLTMRLRQQAAERVLPDYDAVLSPFLEALNARMSNFLEAINKNTTATQEVLARLETELAYKNGSAAFDAPIEILEEGEYLKAQLAGVVSTATPGDKFKEAAPRAIPSGLDVLAAAVRPRKTGKPA
jgi:hypothetical protein